MQSNAYTKWTTTRSSRLDRLVVTHDAVRGVGPGRRWFTEELNQALITRLAAEFQGFCRDLHNDASKVVASQIEDPALRKVVADSLLAQRKLDRGNATWGNVCEDFKSLGIDLAKDVGNTAGAARYSTYTRALETLNEARNAIAHQDAKKLQECLKKTRLNLTTFKTWRKKLDRVAKDMDCVTTSYLEGLAGESPWH